ncbi:probable 2-oxoglutarate-dependent dioxygenase At5g05600 [Amborella trichopoda]|uniref:probable 2-oxoglutarate-dependent dioxygenase At5g05600 n=1 Tax=Amborella trichopoda TaxID=13333 RepID=UPI0009C00763|nr:probable 2-oxoglutarate-dependent dioxygenase At5g05600 [Amborella trichopoda]|eukprot:XP_020528180.1 probable 2-oxoglutarate-dependent dioxygenase At5g05600 [Amborella trichopoda]
MQAVGHGISKDLMNKMRKLGKEFFELPLQERMKVGRNLEVEQKDWVEGYAHDPVEFQDQKLDWIDRLYLQIFPENHIKLQFWPENPAVGRWCCRESLDEFRLKMKEFANQTLRVLAELVGLRDDFFTDRLDDEAIMASSCNFYPPCPRSEQVLGFRPHSDRSGITVLLPDTNILGLQVLKDETWHQVPAFPHALLVNIGDQMEIMTNGIFKSAVHRAVTNKEKPRISMANFYSMAPNKGLGPIERLEGEVTVPIYQTMNVEDYLKAYVVDCHIKRKRAIHNQNLSLRLQSSFKMNL